MIQQRQKGLNQFIIHFIDFDRVNIQTAWLVQWSAYFMQNNPFFGDIRREGLQIKDWMLGTAKPRTALVGVVIGVARRHWSPVGAMLHKHSLSQTRKILMPWHLERAIAYRDRGKVCGGRGLR